ncbi:hypothetical protein EKO27_g12069, partial [Xylaria grammica]
DLLYMALDGAADVCILVYGPTGSGKSYTMGHVVEAAARKIFRHAGHHPHRYRGDRHGEEGEGEEEGARVTARYIECYQEALYDLFSAYTPGEEEGTGTDTAGRRDEARQRTEVTQAVTPVFRDAAALLRGLAEADRRRKTAATKLNARSSRSHAILTLYLDRHRDEHDDDGENAREARMAALSRDGSTRLKPGFRAGEEEGDLGGTMTGKSITLVDLAGSEPLNQHDDDDDKQQQHGESTAQARREETKKINLSLHELRNVIAQLSAPPPQPRPPRSRSLSSGDKEQQPNPNPSPGNNNPQTNTKKPKTPTTMAVAAKKEGKAFVPYNNSKLTRLLKYSLGFGARTLFLVCVSPLAAHAARTEASLEFAGCNENK